MLNPLQVRALARQLTDTARLLAEQSGPDRITAALGWQIRDQSDQGNIRLDSGLAGDDAYLHLDPGHGRSISVPICATGDNTAAGTPFRNDAFAAAVRALTEEYGPPSSAEPGSHPRVTWRVAAVTLTLVRSYSVQLTVMLDADARQLRVRAADEPSADWGDFAEALVMELAKLPLDAFLQLFDKWQPQSGGAVQFLQKDKSLWAEVCVQVPGWLTDNRRQALAEAGWQVPVAALTEDNWWYELPWPAASADYRKLAAAVVIALHEVYQVVVPLDLVYKSWEWGGRRRTLRLPDVTPLAGE
jgi:hypothetical protein